MSAGHGLGIVVGSVRAVAAVHHGGARTDYDTIVRDATLRLSDGEAPQLGATTEMRAGAVEIDGFVARVGDPVGILTDDGSVYAGEDLTASAVACLVDLSGSQDGAPVVLAHPTVWPQRTVDVVLDALERAGVPDVTPTTEAAAAVEWLASTEGPLGDATIVVYDLGASTLDIAVVRTGADAGVLGTPVRSEDVCGAQFDHATLQYVLAHVGDQGIDPFDPATERALRGLRVECARAKETLSHETETDLAVDLPGIRQQVRLVRSELEDLIREPLTTSMALLREAIHSAGLELRDVDRILLAGGGSAIPLVAELISTELGGRIASSHRPMDVAAMGAAVTASRLAEASNADVVRVDDTATVALKVPAALPESRPLAAPRVNAAAPAAPTAVRDGMSRGKKTGIVVAAAAAITVLAAGGLSLGTGGSLVPHSSSTERSTVSTPQSTGDAATPTSDSAVAGGTAQTADEVANTGSPRPVDGAVRSADRTDAPRGAATAPPAGNTAGSDAQQPAPAAGGNSTPGNDQSAPAPVQSGGGQTGGGQSGGGQQGGAGQGGGQTVQVPQVNLPDVSVPTVPKVPSGQIPSVGGVLDPILGKNGG